MNADVCVVVTVPTAAEELRSRERSPHSLRSPHLHHSCHSLHTPHSPRCSNCGSSPKRGDHCERCWRLSQIAGNSPPAAGSRRSGMSGRSGRNPAEEATLERLLRSLAGELRLEEAVFWTQDVAGRRLQARFHLQKDERFERLLRALRDWGVGERSGTHFEALACLETRARTSPGSPLPHQEQDREQEEHEQEELGGLGWQSFVDSVRCRLNVNQVVRQVRRDAALTFDSVVLLAAAALLSCVGLAENSFLFLSSSMLISPLMGPVVAATFGSVIGDRELRWLGLRNELLGIAVSAATGFSFGALLCVCGLGRFFAISSGLTEEILSRCDLHSLALGVCTALASGAAGAIAVLGGNAGSLVGVAISASLLPPAVNAGMLWALAVGAQLLPEEHPLLASLRRRRSYSAQLSVELVACAAVSMALTLLNVVCVWLRGVLVLRVKEVAPAVRRHQQFWRHDVRTARQVAHLDPALQSAIDRLDEAQLDVEAPHYQRTWSPETGNHQGSGGSKERPDNYHTVHGFREFCITLHRLKATPRGVQPPSVMELFDLGSTPGGGGASPGGIATCGVSTGRGRREKRRRRSSFWREVLLRAARSFQEGRRVPPSIDR
ncbi:LOW QUALITY PROTEIN: uncharacterized protein LOC108101435 [Drosophila ficusphila]|uniref:LOW QUALITY PROTEIN: uncharacterized protein LOC108101435 n=1 Tax=Drosophila ficusphila TaxID=30025 RepID=UPI001C892EC7|nr:LOW QUALITY PROTEIN: uncharacterized protein LOC108101435 [Drosophila ficusphila]